MALTYEYSYQGSGFFHFKQIIWASSFPIYLCLLCLCRKYVGTGNQYHCPLQKFASHLYPCTVNKSHKDCLWLYAKHCVRAKINSKQNWQNSFSHKTYSVCGESQTINTRNSKTMSCFMKIASGFSYLCLLLRMKITDDAK